MQFVVYVVVFLMGNILFNIKNNSNILLFLKFYYLILIYRRYRSIELCIFYSTYVQFLYT